MNNATKQYILCGLILLSGIVDIITFYFGRLYAFEINPLFILTQSILLVVVVKLIILCGLCYLIIWNEKANTSDFKKYLATILGVFVIIMQLVGSISNIQITRENPDVELALPPAEATNAYNYMALIWYFYPLIIALFSFKLYEFLYKRGA